MDNLETESHGEWKGHVHQDAGAALIPLHMYRLHKGQLLSDPVIYHTERNISSTPPKKLQIKLL